jgi:hypothetical protein
MAFPVKFLKVTGALFRRYQLLVILVVEQYDPYKAEGQCKARAKHQQWTNKTLRSQ